MVVSPGLSQRPKSKDFAISALSVALAGMILGAWARENGAQGATHSRTASYLRATSTGSIVFLRQRKWLDQAGDLWVVDAAGQSERRLTTQGRFSGLTSDGRRVACLGAGGIYVLAPPDWQPKHVSIPPLPMGRLGRRFPPEKTWLHGTPCWRDGTDQLFVGTGLGDAGDGGLFLADLHRHTIRRVLPPIDADFPLNDEIKLSPEGTRVASGGWG